MKIPFKLPHKIEERNRVVGFLVGVLLAVVFTVLYFAGPLKNFDNFDLDLKFKTRHGVGMWKKMANLPLNEDILLVLIDDETLEWEGTFPDDPLYYVDIIEKLGEDGTGALGAAFSIDYSRQFGRKVDPNESMDFQSELDQVGMVLSTHGAVKRQMLDQVEYFREILDSPESAAAARDIGAKLEEMVFSPDLTKTTMWLGQVSGYAEMRKDLSVLSPDREELLNGAIARAKNVYFTYEAKNHVPVKYGVKQLMENRKVNEIFQRIMRYPTLNRPEDAREAVVFDAYQNLLPEEIEQLIKAGEGKYDEEVIRRLKSDMEEKKEQLDEFLRQNERLAFDLPPRLKNRYVKLRHVRPLLPEIGEHTAGQGIHKAEFSPNDGTLRKLAPAVEYDGKLYAHVDFLLAMKYLGVKPEDMVFEKRRIILKNAVHPRKRFKKDLVIPLQADGTMLINWAGKWADTTVFDRKNLLALYVSIKRHEYFNLTRKFTAMNEEEQVMYWQSLSAEEQKELQIAQQVVETITPEEAAGLEEELKKTKGRIFVVGRTAVGSAETNPTPLEPRYHAIGIHANALNTLVEDIFIRKLPDILIVLVFFALSALLGFVGGLVHFKSAFVTAMVNFLIMVAVGLLYALICFSAFAKFNLNMPLLVPLALIVITFLLVFLYRFMTEEMEKKKMKNMFSTYVNKEVVDSLVEDPDKLKLGGEWMNCTIFFSDVAGFTSISESLKPEELVELLNEYLTAMTDIIFEYGGTLDKYIGDAIVAIYGAPIPFDDHAKKACMATIDMQNKLAEMRAVWKEQGKHELLARSGIHTGDMIAGNVGSEKRFNYTVMGENVDFGEHLESGGKKWGTFMSISETVKEQCGDHIITRWMDIDRLKGYPKPIKIYELLAKKEDGIPENVQKGVEIFEEALVLYFKRQWDEAIEKFNRVFEYMPDDMPTQKIIARCEEARANPPGEDFDELLAKA